MPGPAPSFCPAFPDEQLGQRLPIQMVKKLMRHLSLQMTVDLYTDLEMEEIGAELWQLPALFAATDTPARHASSRWSSHPAQPLPLT